MSENELLMNRAKAAVLSRDFPLAVRLYKSLLRQKPQDIDLLMELGNLYVKSGNDDLALSVFKQIITLHPDHFDALNNLGGVYRRLRKYPESIAVLEQALATGYDGPQVLYNLGSTYKLMEKYDDAIECFEEVISQNPLDALAFNHVGVIHALRGDHEAAVASYTRGLKIDQNHPVLLYNMARSLEALGKSDSALSAYEGALRSKPGWLEAIDAYSHLLVRQKRTKDAANVLAPALRLHPKDVKLHTRLGKAYMRQYDFGHAEEAYEGALSCNESYEPALSGLAMVQEELGKVDDAVKTMQRLESVGPDDPVIVKQYVHVLLSAGQFKAASLRLASLWKQTPDDLLVLNLLGQYYICAGDDAQLSRCFKKIESLDPVYADHLRDGAYRYRQKGNLAAAENLLRQYLNKHGSDSGALAALADIAGLQGNDDHALDFYRKAVAADKNNIRAEQGAHRLEQTVIQPVPGDDPVIESASYDDFETPSDEEIASAADQDEPAIPAVIETPDDPFDFDQFGIVDTPEDDTQNPFFFDEPEPALDQVAVPEGSLDMLTDSDLPLDADVPSESVPEPVFTGEPAASDPSAPLSSPVPAPAPEPFPVYAENSGAAVIDLLQKHFDSVHPPVEKMEPAAAHGGDAVLNSGIPSEPEQAAAAGSDEDLFEKAAEMLPSIVSMLMDPDAVAQFKPSLEMFKKLRALSEFLPSPRKEAFLSSRTRLLLDYVISKLSGAPGLLAAADALRKSGLLPGGVPTPADTTGTGRILATRVLTTMRAYVAALPDPLLRQALDAAVAGMLEKV
jgi:tetratricopeptide (TPR) repeat protein